MPPSPSRRTIVYEPSRSPGSRGERKSTRRSLQAPGHQARKPTNRGRNFGPRGPRGRLRLMRACLALIALVLAPALVHAQAEGSALDPESYAALAADDHAQMTLGGFRRYLER